MFETTHKTQTLESQQTNKMSFGVEYYLWNKEFTQLIKNFCILRILLKSSSPHFVGIVTLLHLQIQGGQTLQELTVVRAELQ